MKLKPFFIAMNACLVASGLFITNQMHAQTKTNNTTANAAQTTKQVILAQMTPDPRESPADRPYYNPNEFAEMEKYERETHALEREVSNLNREIMILRTRPVLQNKRAGWRPMRPVIPRHVTHFQGERVTQGVTVTTSPYLGLRSAFDASDLVVNLSTMNEDLRLLQQRQTLEKQLCDAGIEPLYVDRPLIELSGAVEGQLVDQDSNNNGNNRTNIDLTRAELDFLSYISQDITGLITLGYDNSPLPGIVNGGQIQGAGQRIANSRVFLKRGFLTIGNLNKFPFYFSLGQMYAPFGIYTSQLLDAPMTQVLGQTNNRIALLGFYEKGLYAEGYAFRGDAGQPSHINNGGANIGYKYTGAHTGFNVGVGGIGNIADANGFQNTGASLPFFPGFGFTSDTEDLQHGVPGFDAHGEYDIGKLALIGEFVTATRSFSPLDLSYNWGGARPRATHFEADYTSKLFCWPAVYTVAYGHSYQALGLNLPRASYFAVITTSIWKDTIEAIEYRHDDNYPPSDWSSGNNGSGTFNIPVRSPGGGVNTVTLQAGIYF